MKDKIHYQDGLKNNEPIKEKITTFVLLIFLIL